jgi:hypothetical protein
MNGKIVPIIVAIIGATAGIGGAYFTAKATADGRVNIINTQVQVLQERQSLQYQELKQRLERIEKKLDQALK